ncbi:MAG: methyltransferase domain-containing protein [Chloroflexota bacterium]
MDRKLLDYILCPVCGEGNWMLHAAQYETVPYHDGAREEVRVGELACGCGRRYPIEEFVLSFAELFSPDLAREAAFWDRFYIWNLEHGAVGFHDLRRGFAPFMSQGVREAFPYPDTIERYSVHRHVADHPALRAGDTLLDMGVGLGWTSLHFARSGYKVTAFDPSLRPMQAAKKYAIEQGIFIEYICTAVGYLDFRSASFDNVTAFHSLHHVPDVQAGLTDVQRWLKPGGALAVDEHITNSKLAGAIGAELHRWASSEVFPRYRTISADDMATLPSEPHSAFEDVGAEQIRPLLHTMFDVKEEKQRHVVLDHYSLLYYLWKDKEKDAFVHALEIADNFQELLRLVDPDGGEYITIIATNDPSREPEWQDTASHLDALPANQPSEADLDQYKARLAALEKEFAEQGAWALELEKGLKQRNAELKRLRDHLRRIENGKVMRLMKRLGRSRQRR